MADNLRVNSKKSEMSNSTRNAVLQFLLQHYKDDKLRRENRLPRSIICKPEAILNAKSCLNNVTND